MYTRGSGIAQLLVDMYVDDLIITSVDLQELLRFKGEMKCLFHMSDLRLLTYYHGFEVHQSARGITINQAAYAAKLLGKAGMAGCNPCHVSLKPNCKLSKASSAQPADDTSTGASSATSCI